jgi:alpha-glucosidase
MDTFGTGPFSNVGGLDFLDHFARLPVGQRREVLERIFCQVEDRPYLLGWKFFPEEVVAAAAIVAACLPGGENIRQELAYWHYTADAILPAGADLKLSVSASKALLVAAGRDGLWHDAWANPEEAARARQTTDQLAAIFFSEHHSQDQELPLQF